MSRWTRSMVIGRMWERGMPSTDPKFANVFFAARKAGLNDDQAFALACIAYNASKGYLDHLTSTSRHLRVATLERKAAESPRSVWAYLKFKLQLGFRYVTDEEIRDAGMKDYPAWSAWADTLP